MWEQWIRDLICRLYKRWNGDCADLDTDPDLRCEQVEAHYRDKGPPTFADPAARAAFLADLTELEDGLKSQNNSLDPASTALLNTMIADLRKDLP